MRITNKAKYLKLRRKEEQESYFFPNNYNQFILIPLASMGFLFQAVYICMHIYSFYVRKFIKMAGLKGDHLFSSLGNI